MTSKPKIDVTNSYRLRAELVACQKMVALAKKKRQPQEEIHKLEMQVQYIMEMFTLSTGDRYTPSLTVSAHTAKGLKVLFLELCGFEWEKSFKQGWIGSPRTVLKPEIELFEMPAGMWGGISLDDREPGTQSCLASILLESSGAFGELPDIFDHFEELRTLRLGGNIVFGTLPDTFTALQELEYLSLRGSAVEGELRADVLYACRQLRELDLSFTEMGGRIPDAWGGLDRLNVLNLAGNRFEGELPPSMARLSGLNILNLRNNPLEGEPADVLRPLNNLTTLNLNCCGLSGPVDFLWGLTKLRTVDIGRNAFTGEIPECVSDLRFLETLYMYKNKLSGELPPTLFSLRRLTFLNLADNHICGHVPPEVGDLTRLRLLDLSLNYITGSMPSSISKLDNLRDFAVHHGVPSSGFHKVRGFSRQFFDRVYKLGPEIGLNNI